MSLKFLPVELENMIVNYKEGFEKYEEELKKVFEHRKKNVEYTWGKNDTTYELWCYHYSKKKEHEEYITVLEEHFENNNLSIYSEVIDIIDHN